MTGRLEGKAVILTGAATGLGRGSALRFGLEGATILVADLDIDGAERVAREIRSTGGKAIPHEVDVASADAVQAMVDRAVAEFGRLDILYANAGVSGPVPFHEMSLEDYRWIIGVNLESVIFGVRAALPIFMKQKGGVFLSTSSGAGLNAAFNLAVYGAAKAGVAAFMKNIAIEYGQHGIRANTIAPGPMLTEKMASMMDQIPGGAEAFGKAVPSGRLGTPEDVAATAVFLASDEASFLNGVVVPVDGGIHARLGSPDNMFGSWDVRKDG